MALIELIEKGTDADLVRELLAFAAERMIAERVSAFLSRPIEGVWPYLWIDATYLKVREAGRILGSSPRTSTAVIVAVGVNTDGRREVLGVATGASEAEPFWKAFLRSLADRSLRGGGSSPPTTTRGCGRRPPRCSAPLTSGAACTG